MTLINRFSLKKYKSESFQIGGNSGLIKALPGFILNDQKAPSIVQECAEYSAACFNADGMDAFLTNLDRKDPMKASPTPRVSITSTVRAD